jgi:hypothetical protein
MSVARVVGELRRIVGEQQCQLATRRTGERMARKRARGNSVLEQQVQLLLDSSAWQGPASLSAARR